MKPRETDPNEGQELKICEFCKGCGQVTNDEKCTPWKEWLDLPIETKMATSIGIVRPVLCPACNGKGRVPV